MDNNHWVVWRSSKEFNLVELFVWMGTPHEKERALLYASALAAYLLAVGHLMEGTTYRVHKSPFWHQVDGSSCGLFTLGCIVSLAHGLRVDLDCSTRPRDWRRFFTKKVVEASHWPTRPSTPVSSCGTHVSDLDSHPPSDSDTPKVVRTTINLISPS